MNIALFILIREFKTQSHKRWWSRHLCQPTLPNAVFAAWWDWKERQYSTNTSARMCHTPHPPRDSRLRRSFTTPSCAYINGKTTLRPCYKQTILAFLESDLKCCHSQCLCSEFSVLTSSLWHCLFYVYLSLNCSRIRIVYGNLKVNVIPDYSSSNIVSRCKL